MYVTNLSKFLKCFSFSQMICSRPERLDLQVGFLRFLSGPDLTGLKHLDTINTCKFSVRVRIWVG